MYQNHRQVVMDILSERLKNKISELDSLEELIKVLDNKEERSFLNMLASEIQDFFYYGGE